MLVRAISRIASLPEGIGARARASLRRAQCEETRDIVATICQGAGHGDNADFESRLHNGSNTVVPLPRRIWLRPVRATPSSVCAFRRWQRETMPRLTSRYNETVPTFFQRYENYTTFCLPSGRIWIERCHFVLVAPSKKTTTTTTMAIAAPSRDV